MTTSLAPERTEITVALPELHAAQRQIVREAGRFNVLQCGRRFGKTTTGVDRAIDTLLDGKPVGWFSPTYRLLAEARRDLLALVHDVVEQEQKTERTITLITGGRIDFWSLDDPDAGRSRKYARVIIDEAGIVRELEQAWQGAIRPTLADYQGDAWFFGTPKGRNYFHRLFLKGQNRERGWMSWRFATIENPYIASSEIDAARADSPDAVFKQEWEGVPADDGGNPFGLTAIAACVSPETGKPAVLWGIDLAKSEDWTVLVGFDAAGHTAAMHRWQGPWEMTLSKIHGIVGKTPALVDSTGVGDPVLEALQKLCPNAEGFKFSAGSKQQLMEGLAVAIHQKTVTILDGVMRHELESFGYEYTKSGVWYGAPAGLHDDAVIALALAVRKRSQPVAAPPRAFLLG